MKDIELPPLSKDDHPEPRTMQWSDLELYAIKSYARAAVEADRAQRVPDGWSPSNLELAEIYKAANGGDAGECGPITAAKVFSALRAMLASAPAQPAQQEPRIPAEFDVRSILLSISPGEDGMGHEVYAASVADVEGLLTSMGQELEEWQLGIRRLPTAAHQEPPQPVERKPMTDDQDRALCEAFCNAASDEYFKARPQLDSDVNRRIFYAGHRKAWLEWQTAHGIKE